MVDFASRDILNQQTSITRDVTGNRETITETTTTDTLNGSVISDVNLIPYIRRQDIDFVAFRIRPNREHFYYFDDVNMSHFVQRLNIIQLDNNDQSVFPNFLNAPHGLIRINGGLGRVILAETDFDSGNTVLYVSELKGANSKVMAGNTALIYDELDTGVVARGNVISYWHQSGVANTGSNTSYIFLSPDADGVTENVYRGNVITIVTGSGGGQSSNIVAYNASTRKATISPALTSIDANSIYSIGDYRGSYSSNTTQRHWSTPRGYIAGVFHIPDPSQLTTYQFRTGDRIFRILDNPRNDNADWTSKAEYRYTANGLKVDRTQIVNRNIRTNTSVIISTPPDVAAPPPPPSPFVDQPIYNSDGGGSGDPIAESFYVDERIYPEGLFVTSIDLFFKNKSSWAPIEVQIRPMVNGVPSDTVVLPYAICSMAPEDVVTTDSPNTSNSLSYTKFTFPSPVYLNSNREYAFVVITDDLGYDIYVAGLGGTVLGTTNRIVSKQPYLGSMFKSQNGTTFTPIQDQDIMFRINKAKFTRSGSVTFNELKDLISHQLPYRFTANNYVSNTEFDLFTVHSDAAELPGTKLTYNYRATANASGAVDSTYQEFKPDATISLDARKVLFGPTVNTKSFYMQVALATNNPDISPVLFHNRQQLAPQKMLINNMEITNSIITIANGGSGYTRTNTSLFFSGLSGSGANGYIVANTTTGAIEGVIMDGVGSGYFDNVTCNITSTDGTGGSILVAGETDKSGGPALARYISKTVVLKDGRDAGDLRVKLTAAKPRAASISVYYKVRNKLDPDPISQKNWVRMVQVGNEFVFSDPAKLAPIEYEYRPSTNSNNITYSTSTGATYKTFNEFKIKVVLASSSTLAPDIPSLFDLQAFALPADIF